MNAFLALLLSLVITPAYAQAPNPSRVVKVMVLKGDGHYTGGTGFVVEGPSGRYYTLTNAHVCALSLDEMMIAYSEKQDEFYSGLHILRVGDPKGVDLCVLEPAPHVPPSRMGAEPHPLQALFVLGHPGLGPLALTRGYIISISNGVIYSTAQVLPGNSGSPMYNNQMEVVGIVNAMSTVSGESFGFDIDSIKEFMRGL